MRFQFPPLPKTNASAKRSGGARLLETRKRCCWWRGSGAAWGVAGGGGAQLLNQQHAFNQAQKGHGQAGIGQDIQISAEQAGPSGEVTAGLASLFFSLSLFVFVAMGNPKGLASLLFGLSLFVFVAMGNPKGLAPLSSWLPPRNPKGHLPNVVDNGPEKASNSSEMASPKSDDEEGGLIYLHEER